MFFMLRVGDRLFASHFAVAQCVKLHTILRFSILSH